MYAVKMFACMFIDRNLKFKSAQLIRVPFCASFYILLSFLELSTDIVFDEKKKAFHWGITRQRSYERKYGVVMRCPQ